MQLAPAGASHVHLIAGFENRPEIRPFITPWSPQDHTQAMRDSDTRYFLIPGPDGPPVGHVILRGLLQGGGNIELKRIVVSTPEQGLGRQAMKAAMAKVFGEMGAHRFWLDVFVSNERARHLYASLGFQADGVLREAVKRDGAFHSLILMSILKREYDAAS